MATVWQKLVQISAKQWHAPKFMSLHFMFFADQISCRSYVASVCRIRSLTVPRFSLLLTTMRSWPAIPVHVSTVCDSSTMQATKLLLKVVLFFSCLQRLQRLLLCGTFCQCIDNNIFASFNVFQTNELLSEIAGSQFHGLDFHNLVVNSKKGITTSEDA